MSANQNNIGIQSQQYGLIKWQNGVREHALAIKGGSSHLDQVS